MFICLFVMAFFCNILSKQYVRCICLYIVYLKGMSLKISNKLVEKRKLGSLLCVCVCVCVCVCLEINGAW
uniref:Secreted protein n=1 Tax=Arundo donax TaxID=35708 RepID=A0A0A9DF51_ARUDO